MSVSFARLRFVSFLVLISQLCLPGSLVMAQQKPAAEEPEVLRITTDLVQTGVTVFDKQGRFVDGLTAEQFELQVDGNPVKLSFFDQVTAGTTTEDRQIRTVSREKETGPSTAATASVQYRGRTIIFFVDDMHLRSQSVTRTRKLINDFIDNQMDPDDQVAIGSPSGQIGFLSRLTEVKPVLRAAVARLNYRPYSVNDAENINMTEYQALRVDQGDRDTTNHFVTEMMKASSYRISGGTMGPPQGGPVNQPANRSQERQGGITPEMAERNVKNRAQIMLRQSAAITSNTLASLENTIRATSQIPGRKLVFFISDGFYLNDRNTGFGEKLKQITDAAIRSGVVVYSLDARGIVGTTDASSNRSDPFGNLSRANVGELSASQDPLTAVAADTGGRALLNSESLGRAITDALKETANYYLLAWQPPTEAQKGGNFRRIEVRIVGRPELTVRMPRGFVSGESKAVAESKESAPAAASPDLSSPAAAKGVEADLRAALMAPSPKKGLPTQLSTSFIDVPTAGAVLNASIQIATGVLDYGADGKQPAAIDIAGVLFNDQGKAAGSFKNRINVNPPAGGGAPAPDAGVIYNHKLPLKAGLYQVRVATRDDRSRRVGSDSRWIEIPDLGSKKVTLSSLLIGGQFVGAAAKQTTSGGSEDQMQFSVDRRFTRGSHLSALTFIYNAARAAGGSGSTDLDAQIKILRGGQAIISSPVRKLALEAGGDPARIPYGADIKLNTLPPGRYLLRVEVNDRVAKASASQETVFQVE